VTLLDYWPAVLPLVLALAIAAPRLFTVRSENRRTDARTLAEAYGHVIDRLERQTDDQGQEIRALRDQVTSLMQLVGARDAELSSLRSELASERADNSRLRGRVEHLERQMADRTSTP
jgi:septal ring factor EnvC (AmiA/AmiB activator)